MHHEILLALTGCPGSLFAVSRRSGLYEIIPDLPFIHPSEVAQLNRLSGLGTYYKQLNEFTQQQTTFCTSLDVKKDEGNLYHKAMAYGVDKILDSYRKKLVDVEQKCMMQPDLPISHIQHEFEDFHLLLPALDSCVKYVYNHKLQGCQILSFLHQQCSSGIVSVKTAFTRILYTCHHVFYKQLSAWMLHGLLLDQKGEFFIEKIELSHHDEVEQEDDEEASSVDSHSATDKATSQFRINGHLAPSYLPRRVLEKILFIGEAMQIFQTLNASDARPPLPSFSASSGYQLRTDLIKFSQMLTQLQNQSAFQLRDFENKIEHIRNVIAKHLWRLLVEESNLINHLRVVKDIFLLGRGELFLSFIYMADTLMKQSPTSTAQHDINVTFRQAMIKVAMDHEGLAKQFELTLSLPSAQTSGVSLKSKMPNSWKYVGMTHTVSWPLHIVFTPATLEKYSALFHFLLSLRRAQVYLQQCWAKLMTFRASGHCLQAVWQLRTHMGFLIDNLQYYVQVDVLETQFSQLLNKIKSTYDFEAVKDAHSDFVKTLQSQLFFTEPIRRCVYEILELCFSFSELIQGLRRENLEFSSQGLEAFQQISLDFRRQSSLLFRVLSAAKNHHSAPHITQLLLRIDYNRYFTNRS